MDSKTVVVDIRSDEKREGDNCYMALKSPAKYLDDDCVVLDGDPFKPVSIENDSAGESDDLLILAEKGEIACRDYPHPRHLCAKFPFASTPHERHCDLCHCYVCESRTPCVHWGTGSSIIDHCHATDREEFWRCQRRNFKQGDGAPSLVPKLLRSSISVGPPESNKFTPLQKPTIRSCSKSANSDTQKILGICQRSGYVVPRNKFPPRLVPQPLPSSSSNVIRKKRRHNVGSLVPQFFSSGTIYKRTAPLGFSSGTSQSGYSSSYTNYGSQYSRNPSPVLSSSRKNPIGRQYLYGGRTSGIK